MVFYRWSRRGMIWLRCSDWLSAIQRMCIHWRIVSSPADVICIWLQFLLLSSFLCLRWVCCIQQCLGLLLYIGTWVHFHIVSHVSVTNTMSMLFTCMWCMSMSSLGLIDCMFTSTVLSLIRFLKVLSDLLSGYSKLWWIPIL